VGSATVIGVFGLFLLRGLTLAQSSPDLAGSLLATGIVALLGFHIFVNIGITVGMLPVTGIPLPFLSYGGSFYLTTMLCVGVLLSIHVRKKIMRQYQT
jgi:rod shape determining protein RodA